jgi:hypothetical protein
MQSEMTVKKISQKIYFIRNCRVMLDADLALLYEVETKNLNKAVRRNLDRFPEDFMFQVTPEEFEILMFQIGTSRSELSTWGGRRKLPLVFSEQGVAMLSSILRSKRAALVNIEIMRTFVQLREFLLSNKELAQKLATLEKKYDAQFKVVFDAIREMMNPTISPKRKIGIKPD